jgi:hypothetical protein
MNIEQFLKEIERQPKRTNLGSDIEEKPYKKAIMRIINSPYREEIEMNTLPHAYKLLPFSRKPKSLSAKIFKDALYYIEHYPESEIVKSMQEDYLEELSNKVLETKTIIYNNFLSIFNEKREIIEKERTNNVNNIPFNGYDKEYLQQFKILDRQIELDKLSDENIIWFNSTIKGILKYDAIDYIYLTKRAKDKIERKYNLDLRGIKKIKK